MKLKVSETNPIDTTIKTVKTTLNSIVLRKYRKKVTKYISKLSIQGTEITALGSLLFLNKLTRAIDSDDITYFDKQYIKEIELCMENVSVVTGNRNKNRKTDVVFDNLLIEHGVKKPKANGMGNSLKYLTSLFITNFENTNSLSFARRVLRSYFRTIINDNDEIEHTITYMLRPTSRVPYNDTLVRSLSKIGISASEISRGFFVQRDLFTNVFCYLKIQRSIEEFNKKQEDDGKKVRSFTVVPMFAYRRQHIRVDIDMLYRILCHCKTMRVKGKGNKMRNLTYKEFTAKNNEGEKEIMMKEIGKVFDMEKIHKMGGHKDFHNQFMSDGVAVSLLYDQKGKKPVAEKWELQRLKRKCENSKCNSVYDLLILK